MVAATGELHKEEENETMSEFFYHSLLVPFQMYYIIRI